MRFFNTAGPVNCADHYCLPPLSRFNLAEILDLIAQKKYFVLHAPRQTGKTTCLLALMDYLNHAGHYRTLYINVEAAQAAREDVSAAMGAILYELGDRARRHLNDTVLASIRAEALRDAGPFSALGAALTRWAEATPEPTVLFIDEIDSLIGDTLISTLRQLRAGYDSRPGHFPSTIILCGVRDVRDYRIHSAMDKAVITGGSAFNIKAESLRLGDFTQQEVETLYTEHTQETNQPFTPDALATAWDLTQGQPWLVNALAYETCFKMPAGRDRSQPITGEMIQEAKENLILRRETHLDQLADKLKEDRVRRVIGPILQSEAYEHDFRAADVQYVVDLGLVKQRQGGHLQIANRIYAEIIPRELSWESQMGIIQPTAWYVRPDGSLDLAALLTAFQQFFREHSEHWIERFDYKEAGPQLLLQAFLQRIVNGGGRIEREYGLGRMRTDLLVLWPVGKEQGSGVRSQGAVQRAVIEIKLLYKSLEQTVAAGLAQTWEYADRCGAAEAHLVIFDRTPGKTWEAKLFRREEVYRGTAERPLAFPVTVWGM
jgi:hypothetical protein